MPHHATLPMVMPITPARQTAYDVLHRVEGGAWASELLMAATAGLKRPRLPFTES